MHGTYFDKIFQNNIVFDMSNNYLDRHEEFFLKETLMSLVAFVICMGIGSILSGGRLFQWFFEDVDGLLPCISSRVDLHF